MEIIAKFSRIVYNSTIKHLKEDMYDYERENEVLHACHVCAYRGGNVVWNERGRCVYDCGGWKVCIGIESKGVR